MSTLKFAETHNMVAFLENPTKSEGFEQIVDFLSAYTLRYALTDKPTRYDSCIDQFWSISMTKTINGEAYIHARVDGKEIIITKSNVRRDLRLADEEGVDYLLNSTIFENLELIGPKKTTWNEFSSTMASIIICLATNQKFNFSKLIFDSMIRNLEQDNGNIDKTQSKTTPNEASSLGTTSGGGPRVLDLRKTKTTQALEITSLKRRFKKLEKKQSLGEDASKQGRKIHDIDADEDITLVNDQDDTKMFDVNDLHGEDVFVEKELLDKEVNDEVKKVVEEQKVDDEKETSELKELIEIIPNKEEVEIDAIPLAVKSSKIVE
nr:hypothetical protein [Tanacetum cinerariifolium]